MIRNRKVLTPLFILIFGVHGCGLFSSKTRDAEVVFAPTEVGTPEGNKVSKDMGPAGGTLASPDGRLTLTVPQNAIAETVTFAVQPVTNKFDGGLGSSYRLEPVGKTFTNPLEISIRYDDHDLEGTVPEVLSLAYQDKEGAWHMQKVIKLDKDKKTITVSTTHFSIWSLIFRTKLSPSKATLRVGESLDISMLRCNGPGFIDKFLDSSVNCKAGWGYGDKWKLLGEGKLTQDYPRMVYTAPARKPTPNVATVVFSYLDEQKCPDSDNSKGECYIWVQQSYKSEITILDRGYRATGSDGPVVYSGVICSLEKPFTVTGTHPIFIFPFKFEPSSATAGTASYKTGSSGISASGSGSYTIVGLDTDTPRILLQSHSTATSPVITTSAGGTATINLAPLKTDECN